MESVRSSTASARLWTTLRELDGTVTQGFKVTHDLRDHPMLTRAAIRLLADRLPRGSAEIGGGDLVAEGGLDFEPAPREDAAQALDAVDGKAQSVFLHNVERDPPMAELVSQILADAYEQTGLDPTEVAKEGGYLFRVGHPPDHREPAHPEPVPAQRGSSDLGGVDGPGRGAGARRNWRCLTSVVPGAPVVVDATRMCALLVGLRANVRVLKVVPLLRWLEITIETITDTPQCPNCGTLAELKDRDEVRLVDLPAFGTATLLVWRKRRWLCPSAWCRVGSWTERDDTIAAPRQVLRTRAGRWATRQVGRSGRAVTDVSAELECDWHTVNAAVVAHGDALLAADVDRVGTVYALSLDETLFKRLGPKRQQCWSTQLVDARSGQLLDVVEGRTADAPARWLTSRDAAWRARIQWAVMDMSGPYRATFDTMLPDATQVVDPFHLVKHANGKLDDCRRRVQQELLGHRGRKNDPLYRCRRLLMCAQERIAGPGEEKLQGLLRAGDPRGDVAYA